MEGKLTIGPWEFTVDDAGHTPFAIFIRDKDFEHRPTGNGIVFECNGAVRSIEPDERDMVKEKKNAEIPQATPPIEAIKEKMESEAKKLNDDKIRLGPESQMALRRRPSYIKGFLEGLKWASNDRYNPDFKKGTVVEVGGQE